MEARAAAMTLLDARPHMLTATTAGVYTSAIDGRDYPRIQILTSAELLDEGKKPMLPPLILSPYQQAERIADKNGCGAAGDVWMRTREAGHLRTGRGDWREGGFAPADV